MPQKRPGSPQRILSVRAKWRNRAPWGPLHNGDRTPLSGPTIHIVLGGDVRKFGMWVCALLLTVLVSAEASAQRRVLGRVTATTGEPIASASVNVQGTTIGAYTAEDGRFTLQ